MTMYLELQATCNALGYQEGKQYVKEPDCLETVKDLIRFLKREDETCDIRRQLGHAEIVQNDLLPLLVQYNNEDTLWETVVRLLINLTQPAVLCFNGTVPADKSLRNNYLEVESHLQALKEAFINEEVFAIITGKLGELLKLDWEHRHEEHRNLIERLLILIRNILHIPPNPDAEQRTDDDASVHDQVLWAMHVSGLEDILLYVASSEEERNLSMHILEIVSLMFREQNADMLAGAGSQRCESEKQKDERELEMVREQEKLQKRANIMKFSSRHSRFGGTYVVKNFKSISENDLIYHKSPNDVARIELDHNKKPKKKAKNRKPLTEREVKRRSTLSIRLGMKEFCIQFLENCYNPLMYAVKDILNREKSQEHDETYYLWAIRFFMEFCRLHSKQVDLVSETMSVQTFHYIQVQLFQYYEMQQMEKKEAIVWGKRTHLALKAYQELLLTLDSMDRSGNSVLMESSKVMKSNIFYMMEFRDIFLTLLRHFDQSRQSRGYLKDLVETTHLFLKMLEHFSRRTGHLIVQKKRKGGGRKKKPRNTTPRGHVEPTGQELEDLWDEIASELSAIFQGRSDVPTDVSPFDAASEIDVDQQRVDAMVGIQDKLRSREPAVAVAIFRAAREVWPDRDEFGSADISPEDEFMALREIFMTALPRPSEEIPGEPEEMPDDDEIIEEEMEPVQTCEQEFNFREFAVKFAKPEILQSYVLLLADFQKNGSHANHCCIKMLHRIAVDLGYVGMMFQISLFRVFQKIVNSPLAKASRYKEIVKFATYIVRRFVEVAENNKKIFVELLFWKSNKDAIEVVEGYGSFQGKGKVMWTEDAEMEVRRLFEEYQVAPEDDKDTVDCIMERITDPSKTEDLKKPKTGTRAGPWREEDELELHQLYDQYKDSQDPVGSILSEMCKKRSRAKVMEKLLSLGLVQDRKELYKKRGGKSGRSRRQGSDDSGEEGVRELPSDYEDADVGRRYSSDSGGANDSSATDSSSDSDHAGADIAPADVGDVNRGSAGTNMADILRALVSKGYKDQISWIQRGLNRTATDREEEDEDVGVPIVPLTEENETAMEDDVFLDFLSKIGIACPANEQESFWRIPAGVSPTELRNIASGLTLDENNEPVNADKITVKSRPSKPKKKKEKKKKKERQEKVQKKRKNADKFAALKELVKKKSESKKTKRIRKPNTDERSDSEADLPSTSDGRHPTPDGRHPTPDSKQSATKKSRRVRNVASSDSDSDDNMPLNSPRSSDSSGNEGVLGNEARNSSQKKKRVKRMVASSDSDSDDDVPLTMFSTKTPAENEAGSGNISDAGSQHSNGSQSDAGSQSDVESHAGSQSSNADSQRSRRRSQSLDGSQSSSGSQTSNADSQRSRRGSQSSRGSQSVAGSQSSNASSQSSRGSQSQSQGSQSQASQSQSQVDQSQASQSQPLQFLSSSDEDSDKENDASMAEPRPDSATSKRSRSSESDLESIEGHVKKKARLVESSDSEDDMPLAAISTEGSASFPATMYTQGPDSDSDLDDHVPLRKVIQKKNKIESDED